MEQENIQVLFPEQEPPSKLIENLSVQAGLPLTAEPIYVDGLTPEGNTISTAVHNTCLIVDSLGGICDDEYGNSLSERWKKLIL